MHFKPFQAILDHVFFNFLEWVPPAKIQKKKWKNGLKSLKMHFKHNLCFFFKKSVENDLVRTPPLSVEFSTLFFWRVPLCIMHKITICTKCLCQISRVWQYRIELLLLSLKCIVVFFNCVSFLRFNTFI